MDGIDKNVRVVSIVREKWSSDEMRKYRSRFMDLRQYIRGEGGERGAVLTANGED